MFMHFNFRVWYSEHIPTSEHLILEMILAQLPCPALVAAITRVANNHVAAVLCSVMTGCVLVCCAPADVLLSRVRSCRAGGNILTESEGGWGKEEILEVNK